MVDRCSDKGPGNTDIRTCLEQFQTHRQKRAKYISNILQKNVRVLSLRTPLLKFIVNHVSTLLGDAGMAEQFDGYIGAEIVEFLPIPVQSITGTMPFNRTYGATNHESLRRRALVSLPLFIFAGALALSPTKKLDSPLLLQLDFPTYLVWMLEGARQTNFLKPFSW
jgi:hypothetical protein